MTIDEQIAVMQAFKEGKEIESMIMNGTQWYETTTPSWDFSTFYYRVKPEPEPPKYKPFSFEDDLLGKSIIGQEFKGIITGQTMYRVWAINVSLSYLELLDSYTFADGSPCGKLQTNK